MSEISTNAVSGGLPGPPAVPAGKPAPAKRVYESGPRERALLFLALGLGVLCADLFLSMAYGPVHLGIVILVLAWEGALLWYARHDGWKWTRPGVFLTAAVLLLALTFGLFSNGWFWSVNLCALPALMGVQMLELFGGAGRPWWRPTMLCDRCVFLMDGLFCRLGAPVQAASSFGKAGDKKRLLSVLLGLLLVLPVLFIVLVLLSMADALFNRLAGDAINFVVDHFGSVLGRLFLGALAAPFLFGLLYFLRRPGEMRPVFGVRDGEKVWAMDPVLPATVVAVLDVVYLLFTAVQSAALFGGEAYLASTGLSYAEYARSGFFQLVWVSCINLVVVVWSVHFCRREGRSWQILRVLSTGMVALSGLILASAAWRMTLYVQTYGLSFKRLLTYWGMVMLVIFFIGALCKIWRKGFGFFKVFLTASIAGWLLLNFMNTDALVARYNVDAYLTGNLEWVDVYYLVNSSYAALSQVERLPGDMELYRGNPNYTVERALGDARARAAASTLHWENWNLSAFLAGQGADPAALEEG